MRVGETQFMERGEVPLGMFRDTRYHEYYLTIEPDEVLVLYTDGVTEAKNPAERNLVASVLRTQSRKMTI